MMNFLQREIIWKEIQEQIKIRDQSKNWTNIPFYAQQHKDAVDKLNLLREGLI